VLASIADYIGPWQLAFVPVFILYMLLVGGYFLRRSLRRHQAYKRIRLGRCVLISLYASGGGGISGAIMLFLFRSIGTAIEHVLPMIVIGAVVGLMAFLSVGLLVIWAAFNIPPRDVLRASVMPVGSVAALAIIFGAATVVPTFSQKREKRLLDSCQMRLLKINQAVDFFERDTAGNPPESLKDLVRTKKLAPEDIRCAAAANEEVGFFYLPVPGDPRDKPSDKLRACDFAGHHGSKRPILLANGDCKVLGQQEFQELLKKPDNAEFAKKLKAAEGK